MIMTTSVIHTDLPEISPYQIGVHFALYSGEGGSDVHWKGLCQKPNESAHWWGEEDFSDQGSNRGYFNERSAVADAIYCLHRLRGHSAVAALTICYELALPVHQIIEEHFIRLTVSQSSGYGAHDGDVEAMSLTAKEEALIDRTKADAFIAECHGWQNIAFTYEDGTTFTNADRYQEGYGVVLHIDTNDWSKWLIDYETVEDTKPEQVAASLSL